MQNFMLPEGGKPAHREVALSVVIPSHNPEALFFTEIGRLLAQHPDWQVIIVDDSSEPALRGFLPEAANLTVLRNTPAQGAGASRNIGLQAVRGKYTIFLDDDDFMDWRVVGQLMQLMDKAPAADMAVSSYQFLRDGKPGRAHHHDQEILRHVLRGQSSRVVVLEGHERLLRMTNYPWNKLYRTEFIRRIGLRFSETMVQNDVHAHWQSLLGASRILVTDLVQCTQTITTAGSRINNTRDSRRLQAFTALRETYELVRRSNLPQVETVFWAFYCDLTRWIIRVASPEARAKLMQEHVRFSAIAPQNMAALDADTGHKYWSIWDMDTIDETILSTQDSAGQSVEPAHLEIWLTEISRLKRLSVELRGENERLRHDVRERDARINVLNREVADGRGERERLRHDVRERDTRINVLHREVADGRADLERGRREIMDLHCHLDSKAARWAFALRKPFRSVFPGLRRDQQ